MTIDRLRDVLLGTPESTSATLCIRGWPVYELTPRPDGPEPNSTLERRLVPCPLGAVGSDWGRSDVDVGGELSPSRRPRPRRRSSNVDVSDVSTASIEAR